MSGDVALVWFRRDLRVADNRALIAAHRAGRRLVPVYVLDDATPGSWRPGGASRWWLHHSLGALGQELERRGARLVLRRGATTAELTALAREVGAREVYFTRGYEPWARTLEADLKTALARDGVAARRFGGNLLFEPDAVKTQSGAPYKVYTPFWRQVSGGEPPRKPEPAPETLEGAATRPRSLRLEELDLLPTKPDWAGGLRETWRPGEAGASAALARFLGTALRGYAEQRNRPDLKGTSRLSPHLAHGEISPAACWWAALAAADASPMRRDDLETFLKELVWREFSYHLLFHWPDLPEAPFRPEFARFPWRKDDAQLRAWQKGRTGVPIVDAGMRELWHTGWMHNRVRMIVASFLVKNLLIPWQAGETWFWDTLVDADLASNAASWQWVAGSGADAAPYFRIFNPVTQAEKFDPDGDYVRRWVPELARLDPRAIHAPWLAPPLALREAGVSLGVTYPRPIADLAETRARALAAFATIRSSD